MAFNETKLLCFSDLMWDWLEGLGSGLQRENADTWVDAAWPGFSNHVYLPNEH